MKFTVADNTAYAYTGTTHIDASLPALVFIHGAQNDHTVWALQSRYLANHGYRVFALDLPGHGRSEGAPLGSVDELAEWLLDALNALDAGPSTLIGHSMGSLVALAAAAKAPDLVRAITLIGAAYPMQVADVLLDAARTNENKAIEMIANWSHSSVNHRPGAPGPGFSVYMQAVRLMQRQAPGVLLNDLKACHDYAGGLDAADKVTCPTLFISGKQDMMTPPRAAQTLFDRLAASSTGVQPQMHTLNGGHQIMAEQPDGVLHAIKAFVAS